MSDHDLTPKIRNTATKVDLPVSVEATFRSRAASGDAVPRFGRGRRIFAGAALAAACTATVALALVAHSGLPAAHQPAASSAPSLTLSPTFLTSPSAGGSPTAAVVVPPSSRPSIVASPVPQSPSATPTPAPVTSVQVGSPGIHPSPPGSSAAVLTFTPTLASPSAAGNLVTVSYVLNAVTATATDLTPADSHWKEVTSAYSITNHSASGVFYYAGNPGGITSASFTTNGTAYGGWAVMAEWRGASTTNPLKAASTATASNTTSITVGSTAASGDVAVTAFSAYTPNIAGTSATCSSGSGWTRAGAYIAAHTNGHGWGDDADVSQNNIADTTSCTLSGADSQFQTVNASIAVFGP